MLSPRPRRRPRRLQENFARFTNRLALNASWRLGTEPLRPGEKAFTNLLERFRRAKGCPRKVPGGTVDPGKVLAGLARAAESAGAQIVEHAEVRALDFSNPVRLRVRCNRRGRIHRKKSARSKSFSPPTPSPWNYPACAPLPSRSSPLRWPPLRFPPRSSKPSASPRAARFTLWTFHIFGDACSNRTASSSAPALSHRTWARLLAFPSTPTRSKTARTIWSGRESEKAKPPHASAGSKAAFAICTLRLKPYASPSAGHAEDA